jgi:hypothetical protein
LFALHLNSFKIAKSYLSWFIRKSVGEDSASSTSEFPKLPLLGLIFSESSVETVGDPEEEVLVGGVAPETHLDPAMAPQVYQVGRCRRFHRGTHGGTHHDAPIHRLRQPRGSARPVRPLHRFHRFLHLRLLRHHQGSLDRAHESHGAPHVLLHRGPPGRLRHPPGVPRRLRGVPHGAAQTR